MARGASTFRQRDLTAALKGAKAAGCDVARIEIDRAGKIVVVTGKTTERVDPLNDWDETK